MQTRFFELTNPYVRATFFDPFFWREDYLAQRLKHERTCVKNRRKRKSKKR